MSVCQTAIFEIWFHLGEAALKDLRSVAFGIYDWTQANATEVLCRLAFNGLEASQTAEQIAEALPKWPYQQVRRVCGPVAELAARSEPLQEAYDKVIDEYCSRDPIDGFELIAAAARFNRDRVTAKYGDFLRRLSEGAGLESRTAYDDGHVVATEDGKAVVAKSGPTYPQLEDFHRIRAAVLLHELVPQDQEAAARLQKWAANHPEENVRKELREILADPGGSA